MIKAVLFDIDGIITNGEVSVDAEGKERKSFNLREIDALNDFSRHGIKIGAITAEKSDITEYFRKRFSWDKFYSGCKDKVSAIKNFEEDMEISPEDICYIGDGKYDIDAIKYVGLGVCPADSSIGVKAASDIVLHNSGGSGCIEELFGIVIGLNGEKDSPYVFDRLLEHRDVLNSLLLNAEIQRDIQKAGDMMLEAVQNGNAIYFCGNGGSAADSQHIATEFISRFFKERIAINAEALTVNTSSLTAIANDYSFDRVFVRQLEAKGRKGDVLVGITTSGNSENIWKCFEYAIQNGIKTILMSGEKDNITKDYDNLDLMISVPCSSTPRIQEMHILIGHILAEYVESGI